MSCDYRIRIIRAWLLLITVPLLWPLFGFWTFYAATLVVFGLMMPVFGTPCSNGACNDGPATATVVVTGVVAKALACTSGSTNCSAWNTTFICTTANKALCIWNKSINICSSAGSNAEGSNVKVSIGVGGGNLSATVTLQGTFGSITDLRADWTQTGVTSTPADCLSLGTLSNSLTDAPDPPGNGQCDFTAASASASFA